MKKIYIKTTETCNLRCKHCYIGDNRDKRGFFDEIKTIAWLKRQIGTGKDTLISFHGGEPFLCNLPKMQAVCDAFPDAEFDATSNLVFKNIEPIMTFIQKNFVRKATGRPFIKTSWDYGIRFGSDENEALWKKNVQTLLKNGMDVKVITCLTAPFIKNVKPEEYRQLMQFEVGVGEVDFERLTANTTADKSLLPDYDDIDDWLCRFYECNTDFEVDMFANMAAAACGTFMDCRARRCMQDTLTINADGTVGGCPNNAVTDWFYTIDGETDISKKKRLVACECVRNPACYTCELFSVCNGDCHQLSWQNGKCPEPKNLLKRIMKDVKEDKL